MNERASERGSPPHREHALHSKIFDLNNLWEFMYVSDERARDTHTKEKQSARRVYTSASILSQQLIYTRACAYMNLCAKIFISWFGFLVL